MTNWIVKCYSQRNYELVKGVREKSTGMEKNIGGYQNVALKD